MSENALIGKTLKGIRIANDKMALLLETTEGNVEVLADADCCSHTWIEHVELPALGFPATVTAVEDLDMLDLGTPEEYECLAYYGCKITTDKGEIIIDYRNDSNGYYGGNLVWPKTDDDNYWYFYGGVFGQNISEKRWEDINNE